MKLKLKLKMAFQIDPPWGFDDDEEISDFNRGYVVAIEDEIENTIINILERHHVLKESIDWDNTEITMKQDKQS